MRLYELTAAYAAIQQLADDGEDVSAQLAELDDALEAKGTALVAVMRGLDAEADALRLEELRMATRRRAIEANVERLREYVRTQMQANGITKIKGPAFSIGLSDGPERVVVEDAEAVPTEFQRVRTEVDKSRILAAWKQSGECVPGTRIERSTSLRVR